MSARAIFAGVALLIVAGCSPDVFDYWSSLKMDAGLWNTGTQDADADTDSDADADTDSDSDTDTDPGEGGCSDTGQDTGSDTGSDTGTGQVQPDAGTDGGVDPFADGGCPPEMVKVTAASLPSVTTSFCIDKYEASRDDATATSAGTDDSIARSVAGVMPWWNSPMTGTVLTTYQTACAAAGKRLCNDYEWFGACAGPSSYTYVFGNTFDQDLCNSVGACCDEYCVGASIPPSSCDTSLSCGYAYGCYEILPTGDFPHCTNSLGTFDINGNVWEIALSSSSVGFDIRGGAYNCAMPDLRLQCGFTATWYTLAAGFRCCKDPE